MCGLLLWWLPALVSLLVWRAISGQWALRGWMDGGWHQVAIAAPSAIIMILVFYIPLKHSTDREDREFEEFMKSVRNRK
jgi:hypothetical protein